MIKRISILLFLILGVFFACTPFDSSSNNIRLLQGNWMLYDMEHPAKDSLWVRYNRDSVIIIFEKDSLFDYYVRRNIIYPYSFKVNHYDLMTYHNDSLISKRDILALSGDSLVIGNNNIKFKYRKFEN